MSDDDARNRSTVDYGDRSVYLPAADALVLADLHVGRAATSNVEFPLGERADLSDRLDAAIERFDPGTVVVAGDLLHSFSRVPRGVSEAVADLATIVADAGAAFVVVEGNHDAMLDAVRDAAAEETDAVEPFEVVGEYALDDGTVVCHGHEPPDAAGDRYVVGHEHPAIRIEGRKRPCFLDGRGVFRGADVLVLPAFSRLARGCVVNGMRTRDCLSPLVTDLDACRPVVVADGEGLTFPPLAEFRDQL